MSSGLLLDLMGGDCRVFSHSAVMGDVRTVQQIHATSAQVWLGAGAQRSIHQWPGRSGARSGGRQFRGFRRVSADH